MNAQGAVPQGVSDGQVLSLATRRALFAAAGIGAVGAIAGRAAPALAANGSPLVLGSTSNSATAPTTLTTATTGIGLTVKNTGGGAAMYFESTKNNGVAGRTAAADKYGISAANVGAAGGGAALAASGGNNRGVVANTASLETAAVSAENLDPIGGIGELGSADIGVFGVSFGEGSPGGLFGALDPQGVGLVAINDADGAGLLVLGTSDLVGSTLIEGDLEVAGTLVKAAGSFRIDHPLDPEGKWLSHSFVESPEMTNVYTGTVTLGASGAATVELPGYFEALNADVRYQLTAVGAAMPGLHVSHEVAGNRFGIAGGVAGGKVCWQVTGVRQDAYAKAHPIVVEEAKPTGIATVTSTSARAALRERIASRSR